MSSFKLFWNVHKWTGVVLAIFVGTTATTGFLLLIKKKVAWIQPPTLTGMPGDSHDFISMAEAFDIVLALDHESFRTAEDIDRVDVRPAKRVYKLQSLHGHMEVQVDAVNGAVLGVATRRSDLIEDIHDGSFWAGWVHGWVIPTVAVALMGLMLSGLWLFIEPSIRRRRRKRREAAAG